MSVATEVWGHINGTPVSLFTVSDGANTAKLCEYGATLVELFVPDKHGVADNIVLSYDTLRDYVEDGAYLCATIGRYANRIQGGFSLGGVYYPLTLNDGENNLHGFPGFDNKLWRGEACGENSVRFSLVSADGESGFPGRLEASVTYTLDDNKLSLQYGAVSDKDTIYNPTNHSYFNISAGAQTVEGTQIQIASSAPFDFREPKRIDHYHPPKGYDHNFIINKEGYGFVAAAFDSFSGRRLTVFSDMPAVQFYTGFYLADTTPWGLYSAFCLETQFSPNTPNIKELPQCVIKAGQLFTSRTEYNCTTT